MTHRANHLHSVGIFFVLLVLIASSSAASQAGVNAIAGVDDHATELMPIDDPTLAGDAALRLANGFPIWYENTQAPGRASHPDRNVATEQGLAEPRIPENDPAVRPPLADHFDHQAFWWTAASLGSQNSPGKIPTGGETLRAGILLTQSVPADPGGAGQRLTTIAAGKMVLSYTPTE